MYISISYQLVYKLMSLHLSLDKSCITPDKAVLFINKKYNWEKSAYMIKHPNDEFDVYSTTKS